MRILLSILLSFTAFSCFAWECAGEVSGEETDIDTHIEFASDIILAKVVSANLSSSDQISFNADIVHYFKGSGDSKLTLNTAADSINPEISVGYNYIFFLYGSNTVDFCGITIKLMPHISTLEEVADYAKPDEFTDPYITDRLTKIMNIRANEP